MTDLGYNDFRRRREIVEASPLRVVSAAFDRLADEPVPADAPASLGVAAGASWGEVREQFRAGAMPVDALWVWLIGSARSGWTIRGGQTVLGCTGLAVPMLARVTGRYAASGSADRDDAEAEIVAGFVRQLREIDLDRPHLSSRLWSAAMHSGRAWARRHALAPQAVDLDDNPAATHAILSLSPHGHPDLLLAEAVAAGVITADAAELVAMTWWEGQSMSAVARQLRATRSYWTIRRQLQCAETALVPWLVARTADPHPEPDNLANATLPAIAGLPPDHRRLPASTSPASRPHRPSEHAESPAESGREEARRCA
ncbi:hypothetical protein [Nocardia wallacei]|uniref:hypothetical protein n=1 Tax=Nocardia wallacei TaxID=480035 RepID=UPI002455E669|nr:hypothetical protein [Nocardia wallacei]